jgi:hypothetical protein
MGILEDAVRLRGSVPLDLVVVSSHRCRELSACLSMN